MCLFFMLDIASLFISFPLYLLESIVDCFVSCFFVRSFQYMFDIMDKKADLVNYTLRASYLEVYNERVTN